MSRTRQKPAKYFLRVYIRLHFKCNRGEISTQHTFKSNEQENGSRPPLLLLAHHGSVLSWCQSAGKALRDRASPPTHTHSCPHLREVDGEDGVRPAADIIHPCGSGGPIDVSCIHKLFDITVILY